MNPPANISPAPVVSIALSKIKGFINSVLFLLTINDPLSPRVIAVNSHKALISILHFSKSIILKRLFNSSSLQNKISTKSFIKPKKLSLCLSTQNESERENNFSF